MGQDTADNLIDYTGLGEAYARRGIYALQLEVGDLCFQNCIYCYMNALPDPKNTLSDREIDQILLDAKELGTAIEWLGGEPLIRPGVLDFLARGQELDFRNNVWTGGLPLADPSFARRLAALATSGLIAFHLSTLDPALYESLHPGRTSEDIRIVLRAVELLLEEGYPPSRILNSVTFTGLQPSWDLIETVDFFGLKYGIKTSLNIYHTYLRPGIPQGELVRFVPSPSEVVKVRKRMGLEWKTKLLPMNCVDSEYCSATMAVLCDGSATPCATIRPPGTPNIHRDGSLREIFHEHRAELTIERFRKKENLPAPCRSCVTNNHCFGCRSRAHAAGLGLYGHDPRCPRREE